MTLLEDAELDELQVRGLPEAVRSKGFAWHHLPIRDVDVPNETAMKAWRTIGPQLHESIERGARILIHCRGDDADRARMVSR